MFDYDFRYRPTPPSELERNLKVAQWYAKITGAFGGVR